MHEKFPRQMYLLLLLNANDASPIKHKLRLQKLMFLLQKEIIEERGLQPSLEKYNFDAYNYGPFSDDLIDDIEFLKDLNLIEVSSENNTEVYRITEKGKKFLRNFLSKIPESQLKLIKPFINELEKLKRKWNNVPLNKLLRYVYEKYPEYTEKSLIKHLLY